MAKTIQNEIGEKVIAAVREVASHEIHDVPFWAGELAHMESNSLRQTVAETIYGARWLYKLGLVFLTRDDEQNAHSRAQISEYSAAIEAILTDMIVYAHDNNRLSGTQFQKNLKGDPVDWVVPRYRVPNKYELVSRLTFAWMIKVAHEEGIISSPLERQLGWLRNKRNEIHLISRTRYAFTPTSKNAYNAVLNTIRETNAWK